jgi:steroid delta-isomerase-like uncharacterized protein
MLTAIRSTLILCVAAIVLNGLLNTAVADIEANKEAFRRINQEAWSQGQLSVVDEFVAPEYVYHEVALGEIPGPEGLKQAIMVYRTAYPDLTFTINDVIGEGNLVAMRWSAKGIHQGELMGIPATGLETTSVGINIARFDDAGMIVEEWTHWDLAGLMQQLGVVQPPRPGPEFYLWDAESDITGDPGDPAENKLLVLRIKKQFWNGKDIAGLDDTHHTNAIGHDPSIPGVPGYEAYRQSSMMFQVALPDQHVAVDDMIAETDKVVVRWTATGTHQGDLMGIPATEKQVKYTGITIYRIADGKVAETWWAYDGFGLVQQITSPPEWPTGGNWLLTIPSPMGNTTMVHTVWPQDAAGTRFGGVLWKVNANPTLYGMFPEVETGVQFWATESVRIGPNTYRTDMITYGTKAGDGPLDQTAAIHVGTSTWTMTGPDTNEGQTLLASYLPEQDADGDGLPDAGQEPVACTPFPFTSKRVKIMSPCVPPPMPGQ